MPDEAAITTPEIAPPEFDLVDAAISAPIRNPIRRTREIES